MVVLVLVGKQWYQRRVREPKKSSTSFDMGCLIASDGKTKQIDKEMKSEEQPIKILLLGTGNSGKSTFFKQMTHQKDSKQSDRNVLLFNVLSDVRIVINEARKQFSEVQELFTELSEGILLASTVTNEVGLAILALFQELPFLNQLIESRGDYMGLTCGSDSLLYFLGNLTTILSPQYKLTEEDILRVRIKTTGQI
eukprot:TRINITY_DN5595_c0_g2_i5.p1 TRINITY_DN5595_c0_g2~~TRINITY_DN5595_c0_g2_i5.p1  ORF type:complete len:196 (+),score=28.53 TRINITY_DN5595_c0_g2_i5:67-654(+)